MPNRYPSIQYPIGKPRRSNRIRARCDGERMKDGVEVGGGGGTGVEGGGGKRRTDGVVGGGGERRRSKRTRAMVEVGGGGNEAADGGGKMRMDGVEVGGGGDTGAKAGGGERKTDGVVGGGGERRRSKRIRSMVEVGGGGYEAVDGGGQMRMDGVEVGGGDVHGGCAEILEKLRSELIETKHNVEKQAGDIKKLEETLSSLQMKHIQTVEKQGEHIKKLEEALNNLHEQRRKLFNEVQEAKGNIRVFCRCRPLSSDEMSAGCKTVVDFDAAKEGCLRILHNSKIFRFDRVYTPKDDQVDVFADASPMVISVLDGYNVCIFAYGQTGSGKTYTMEGTKNNRGVNYRTLEYLFRISNERRETFSYDISVSVVEVYNEQIRDLLATGPTSKRLEIKQNFEGHHHVPGVVEAKVDDLSDMLKVLQTGSNARAVGSNNINEESSRSHGVLCITVKTKNLMNGECTTSKLWLVDLAGSERLAKTDLEGERRKEAQNINRSLSALGDVISALGSKKTHIPYRNSKLTHLLQDSLGGHSSKTALFLHVSPSDQDVSETLSSLNFATRVKRIELGPVKKQIDTVDLQKSKVMLDKERSECRSNVKGKVTATPDIGKSRTKPPLNPPMSSSQWRFR